MGYKILVAMDFSKMGKKVTAYGYDVAKRFGGEVTFFHVVPEPNIAFNSYAPAIPVILDSNLEDLKNTAKKKLEYYVSEEKDKNEDIKCNTVVEIGDPAQCIIEYAKENGYDLIILGYRGYSAIEALLVGSTANKVTRYAPCSVLIYRPDRAKA